MSKPSSSTFTGHSVAASPLLSKHKEEPSSSSTVGSKLLRATLILILPIACLCVASIVQTNYYEQKPTFKLESVSLTNFSVKPSTHTIEGNWSLGLQVHNYNKETHLLHDIHSIILYETMLLQSTTSPPLEITKESNTFLEATFSTLDSNIDHSLDRVNIIEEDMERDSARFNVILAGHLKIKKILYEVEVSCENIPITIDASTRSGRLIGGLRNCQANYKYQQCVE